MQILIALNYSTSVRGISNIQFINVLQVYAKAVKYIAFHFVIFGITAQKELLKQLKTKILISKIHSILLDVLRYIQICGFCQINFDRYVKSVIKISGEH